MTQWSKEDLEEMCGDDVIDQLAFLAGCNKHQYSNCKVIPNGWIIPDESLREFAELIVRECAKIAIDCDVTECYDFRKGISQRIREHFGVKG